MFCFVLLRASPPSPVPGRPGRLDRGSTYLYCDISALALCCAALKLFFPKKGGGSREGEAADKARKIKRRRLNLEQQTEILRQAFWTDIWPPLREFSHPGSIGWLVSWLID